LLENIQKLLENIQKGEFDARKAARQVRLGGELADLLTGCLQVQL